MILQRVVSGGQSGADQAALDAARTFGISTGGWHARGCRTERGPRREMLTIYGMTECPEGATEAAAYRIRAKWNARDSDGTLCFDLLGSKATANMFDDCQEFGKPRRCVTLKRNTDRSLKVNVAEHQPRDIARWIAEERIACLNVCGQRASKVPDIGEFVESFLGEVIRILASQQG